jgi:peroxiredoxin
LKRNSRAFAASGTPFPDFSLPGSDGRIYTLQTLQAGAPAALIAIFKTDCPTSQFSLPYFNRLREAIPNLPYAGISQDGMAETLEFLREWGARFSHVLYEDEPYSLSDALGVAHVPSLFLLEAGGRIAACDFGYSEDFWNHVAERAAEAFGVRVGSISPADAPRWALG